MESDNVTINLPHHIKNELCTTRSPYRQGRKLTSVKVYTVNDESQHLLVYNVPAINIDAELLNVCHRFGEVTNCTRIPNQEVEDFTHAYHVRFAKVHQARYAKRKMDDLSFFGGILHVCYAPELETVEETKEKLSARRREVAHHLKQLASPESSKPQSFRKGVKRRLPQHTSNSKKLFSGVNHDSSVLNVGLEFHNSLFQQAPSSHSAQPTFDWNAYQRFTPVEVKSVQNPTKFDLPVGPSEVHQPTIPSQPLEKPISKKISRIIFHNVNKT